VGIFISRCPRRCVWGAAFTTENACRRKPNLPPGERALAELARLRGIDGEPARVISLADYAQLAQAAGR
jgi:hypothetical protein